MKRVLLVVAALGTVLWGALYVPYRSELRAVLQQLEAGSQIAPTPCGDIEYKVSGAGPAVLVIHGTGGGYSQVGDLQALLAASGYTAVAMSRFGYLRTPLPADASPAAQADAHACLLDALRIPKAAAIGLSAGAPSAIEYCARHADRCTALVLLVPAISVPGRAVSETTPPSLFWTFVFNQVLRSDFVIWTVTRVWPELLVETVLATPVERYRAASSAERARALSVIRDIFPVSHKIDGLQNDATATTPAQLTGLSRIVAPTLAISAQDDLYGTAAGATYAVEQIAGAQLILFPDGGHAWLGHDAEVRDIVVRFLAQADPDPAGDGLP